jgi:hypothetical protein
MAFLSAKAADLDNLRKRAEVAKQCVSESHEHVAQRAENLRRAIFTAESNTDAIKKTAAATNDLTHTVHGFLSLLGPSSTAAVLDALDGIRSCLQTCLSVSQSWESAAASLNDAAVEARRRTEAFTALQNTLQQQLFAAIDEVTVRANRSEISLSWASGYLKTVMQERVRWQQTHGLNPAELHEELSFAKLCRDALGETENVRVQRQPGESSHFAVERFVHRQWEDGSRVRYVPPSEELALLERFLKAMDGGARPRSLNAADLPRATPKFDVLFRGLCGLHKPVLAVKAAVLSLRSTWATHRMDLMDQFRSAAQLISEAGAIADASSATPSTGTSPPTAPTARRPPGPERIRTPSQPSTPKLRSRQSPATPQFASARLVTVAVQTDANWPTERQASELSGDLPPMPARQLYTLVHRRADSGSEYGSLVETDVIPAIAPLQMHFSPTSYTAGSLAEQTPTVAPRSRPAPLTSGGSVTNATKDANLSPLAPLTAPVVMPKRWPSASRKSTEHVEARLRTALEKAESLEAKVDALQRSTAPQTPLASAAVSTVELQFKTGGSPRQRSGAGFSPRSRDALDSTTRQQFESWVKSSRTL